DLHVAVRTHNVVGLRCNEEPIEESRNGNLRIGQIDLGQNRTAEFGLDHVRGYADHGVRLAHAGIFAAQIKLLSQRILIPKVASRESLVDERNVWAAGGVIRSDRASANHGHSHYLCESGTDSAHE